MLLEQIDCDSSNRKPDVPASARAMSLVMQLIQPESTGLCPHTHQDMLSSRSLPVAHS